MRIYSRFDSEKILFEDNEKTIKKTLENAVRQGADLQGAYLQGARGLVFPYFPPLVVLQPLIIRGISHDLRLELMLRDAWNSPNPQAFIDWALDKNSACPLNGNPPVKRAWRFQENREILREYLKIKKEIKDHSELLRPQMRDADLTITLCKHFGFGIKGVLESANGPEGE